MNWLNKSNPWVQSDCLLLTPSKGQLHWRTRKARQKKEKDEGISSGSSGSQQSLLKWQIISAPAEKMPSGNSMPTMLRLPSANKPPRQEVAFDSKSGALCTKPQCLASELQNNKLSQTSVPGRPAMPLGGKEAPGVLTSSGWEAIKYTWCLTLRCSRSLLYLLTKNEKWLLSLGL